jgi:hypothetical protein
MNRSGTEITAGQGERAMGEVEVMRGLSPRVAWDSCELVLFMLMVLPGCEGHHA